MFEWDVSPNNLICTNYNSNEGNCVLLKAKPFVLPDELKLDLLWLGKYINSDGSLTFLKGHYTLNNAGVCCPLN